VPEVKKLVAEVVEEGTEFVEVDDLGVGSEDLTMCTLVLSRVVDAAEVLA